MSHDTTIGLISGTGEEGRGIALRLAAAGLQIYLGSRSEEKALEGAQELNQVIGQNLILGADNHDLMEKCNILIQGFEKRCFKKSKVSSLPTIFRLFQKGVETAL